VTGKRLCAQLLEVDGSHLLRCVAEALESSPYCAVHAKQHDARVCAQPEDRRDKPDGFPWTDEVDDDAVSH